MGIRNKIFLSVGVSLFALAAMPASAAPLEEVIQSLVKENPSILEAAANRRALDYELEQAHGLYRPQVDLTTRIGPESSTIGNDSGDDFRLVLQSSLTLTQLLFDGFATESEQERQAARIDAAAERVKERSEFIALDLVEAYLDSLRQSELVELATENVAVHEGTLEDVRQRVDSGQTGVGDVQQAEARYADSRATLIQAERDLTEANNRYIRLTGQQPEDLVKPEFDWSAVPETEEEALNKAVEMNPTLALVDADLDVAKAEIAAAKSNNYPTVQFIAGANHNHQVDTAGETYNAFTAQVRVDWNLYRGLIDRHNVYENVERLSEVRERRVRLERSVAEEVQQSWNAMVKAQEREEALGDQVLANSQVVASYRQEFQVGQRDLLDVLDGENELFTARTRQITAEYTAVFGGYRLLASTGQLIANLGVALRGEATGNEREEEGATPDHRWKTDYKAGSRYE